MAAPEQTDPAGVRPTLSRRTIEVWRVPIDPAGPADALRALLSQEERLRADALPDPRIRSRFVGTRAALRLLLGRHLGGEPSAFELRYGVNGKPFLFRHGAADGLRFSVSHAADLALVALALGRDVGVDIERVRVARHADRIATRLFDGHTCALLGRLAGDDHTLAFHHAWTQREAYVKTVGGSVFGTRDPLAFHWPRPHRDVQRGDGGTAWTVAVLEPGPGYVASLVAEGEAESITEQDWDP